MGRQLFLGLALFIAGCGDSGLTNSSALALCRSAIESVAVNPKAVEIPHRKAIDWDGEFTFMWGADGDGVLMPNQFGSLIQTEVHCVVDKETRRVVELIIGGRKVPARK